jgi:ABC-type glycerol-3-phosphate transport system substrate-binding protein
MKKLAAVVAMLLLAAPAAAEVRSVQVCAAKTLTASTTTDCTYTDIGGFEYFSYQVYCGETTDNTMDIDVDFVGGSAAGTAYVAVPTGVTQLLTNYTTEDAWSTLEAINPPLAPVGTIRFTENNGDDDIVCTAILNMGVAK